MSFGENLGTGSLLDALCDYARYVRDEYDKGDHEAAVLTARSIMEGATELWRRLVEEGADA